jgi:hypothetical protein
MNRLTIILSVIVLLLVLVLQQCSSIDLLAVFRNKAHQHLPTLRNGARSENYQLQRVSTNVFANLTYSPIGNFFLLNNQDEVIKIDAKGNEVYRLTNSNCYLPRFSCYVFDSTGVYDFSASQLKKQPFKQLLNLNKQLNEADWQQTFDQLYQSADVVLFGSTSQYGTDPIFLRIHNEWTLLLTTEHEVRISNMEYQAGISFEGYPAKFEPLFLLKDVANKTFSDTEGTTDEFLKTYYTVKLKEKELGYPNDRKLETLSAEKGRVYAHGAYTPFPISWVYPMGQSLSINKEEIKFRCHGTRDLGIASKIEGYLNSFVIPTKYATQSKVSFLRYSFPSNGSESDDNGIYVVKPIDNGTK